MTTLKLLASLLSRNSATSTHWLRKHANLQSYRICYPTRAKITYDKENWGRHYSSLSGSKCNGGLGDSLPVLSLNSSLTKRLVPACCYSYKCAPPHKTNSTQQKAAATASPASETVDTKCPTIEPELFGNESNLGLFAKFKLMYKKYWYVLIPVHVATSIGWFGGFYYLSKCGVDVPSLLEYLHLSETIINKVQGSNMGHWAIAYLCYKVATPLRYAVTLGGTTISIKYLVQTGHIKPLPSKRQIVEMYEQKMAERSAAKKEKQQQRCEKESNSNREGKQCSPSNNEK